ncbi:uncharacterized protein F5147DRAFT_131258 [Suillus discolor]|uniref:Secreted protein n=1 Tax=Suillus discolor TaxID=1912936 RepID=A0A9P7FAA1_9AGAM|nr:uncharacterized protein F5147DRAFT_131258 [Suillus discolor]KAG2110638.1 hypothetical protein F5147DRAFT_131258 [Suillus discolor]
MLHLLLSFSHLLSQIVADIVFSTVRRSRTRSTSLKGPEIIAKYQTGPDAHTGESHIVEGKGCLRSEKDRFTHHQCCPSLALADDSLSKHFPRYGFYKQYTSDRQ